MFDNEAVKTGSTIMNMSQKHVCLKVMKRKNRLAFEESCAVSSMTGERRESETNFKSKCNSNFCILSSKKIANRLKSFESQTLEEVAKRLARLDLRKPKLQSRICILLFLLR